jgi:hypothetical protein
MPGGIIGGIATIIMEGPEGEKSASMTICGVDIDNPDVAKPAIPERAFQYWPDSIRDSIEIGWEFQNLPGASHAMGKWSSNGGRTISFDVTFARFMKDVDKRTTLEKLMDPFGLTKPDGDKGANVDVAGAVRYLRAYCYPFYKAGAQFVEAKPPPIAILNVPNLQLNEAGGDAIYAVMTGCEVEYVKAFPDGTPRLATVSLTFRQVVQNVMKNSVNFIGRAQAEGTLQYNKIDAYSGAGRATHKENPI